MSGEALAFTDSDLKAAAAAYDPALHEAPIVIGHPRHDAPAYGWIDALSYSETQMALEARPAQVAPELTQIVRKGRYKKVSASFYKPDAEANPKPGVYYLRHVGLLGAQPPAIKGLRPVAFADDRAGVVAFDIVEGEVAFADEPGGETQVEPASATPVAQTTDPAMEPERPLLRILRRLRDWFVRAHGEETAEVVLPVEALAALQGKEANPGGAREPATPAQPSAAMAEDLGQGPGERAASLAARECTLARREAAFAEAQKTARRGDNAAFLDDLIASGRFAPGLKPAALDFMDRLEPDATVAFGESGTEVTPLAYFRDLLARLPRTVVFGELASAPEAETGDVEAVALAAQAYQEEMRAKGVAVSTDRAVRHVLNGART